MDKKKKFQKLSDEFDTTYGGCHGKEVNFGFFDSGKEINDSEKPPLDIEEKSLTDEDDRKATTLK